MTIDRGASATITRPDVTTGLPERETSPLNILQKVSGQKPCAIKEVLVETTLSGKMQYIRGVYTK
jgi:hypothetical protein